jgi:hypothetical protein
VTICCLLVATNKSLLLKAPTISSHQEAPPASPGRPRPGDQSRAVPTAYRARLLGPARRSGGLDLRFPCLSVLWLAVVGASAGRPGHLLLAHRIAPGLCMRGAGVVSSVTLHRSRKLASSFYLFIYLFESPIKSNVAGVVLSSLTYAGAALSLHRSAPGT